MADVWDGILVGGAGGAIAGLTVSLVSYAYSKTNEIKHKGRVYRWLKGESEKPVAKDYRSTRAIASNNDLTEDRVRYICSIHTKIYLSTGKEEDMWSLRKDVD